MIEKAIRNLELAGDVPHRQSCHGERTEKGVGKREGKALGVGCGGGRHTFI